MNNRSAQFDEKTCITADHLSCRRGGRVVFSGLSFTLNAGQYLSLQGRNGKGKSTLLRLIAGLLPVHAGTIEIKTDSQAILPRDHMLMVGHLNGLKPVMTLRENAEMYHQTMIGRDLDDANLEAAARQFDLLHLLDQPVQYFSSGQRHRSALMRFKLIPRQIWLMDEPTVGLDADNRAALTAMMNEHLDCGGIIVAATHDPINTKGDVLSLDEYGPGNHVNFAESDGWL